MLGELFHPSRHLRNHTIDGNFGTCVVHTVLGDEVRCVVTTWHDDDRVLLGGLQLSIGPEVGTDARLSPRVIVTVDEEKSGTCNIPALGIGVDLSLGLALEDADGVVLFCWEVQWALSLPVLNVDKS